MNDDSLRILPDVQTAISYSAARIARLINATLEVNPLFSLALSGGKTPAPVYEHLAAHYADKIPWERVHLFWGDERCVDPSDPRSNYYLVHETLLRHITIPEANIHRIYGEWENVPQAAQQYEDLLREFFADDSATFDLALLGIGTDGHFAALFPGDEQVLASSRWVIPTQSPDQMHRISLTPAPFLASANIMFIVTGKQKAQSLQHILHDTAATIEVPAQILSTSSHQHIVWVVDEDAASLL